MRSFKAASSILSPSWMSMARLTFPSRLELNRPEGSFNAAPLANVILTTNAAVGKDGRPRRCRPDPLPLFDDLRVGLVYDFAHLREHLPAPVPKFRDPGVDDCRGRFHRDGPFHVQLQLSHLI